MLTKKYVRTIFVAPKLWILEQFSLNFQTIPRFKEIARIFKGRNDFSKTTVEGRQKYCVSLPPTPPLWDFGDPSPFMIAQYLNAP